MKPPDPSVGHHPAAAGVTGGEPFNAKALLLLASPHHPECPIAPNGQFLVGSHPNLPRPVARYAPHRGSRKTPIGRWHGKPAVMPAHQLVLTGRHPKSSFRVVAQHARVIICRSPMRRSKSGELPALQPRQARVFSSNPQRSAAIFKDLHNPAVVNARRVERVEHNEAHSVEPSQTVLRPHPEIPVARLRQGGYRVLRQTILRLPRIHHVIARPGDCVPGECSHSEA